jgi:hypothetical protein
MANGLVAWGPFAEPRKLLVSPLAAFRGLLYSRNGSNAKWAAGQWAPQCRRTPTRQLHCNIASSESHERSSVHHPSILHCDALAAQPASLLLEVARGFGKDDAAPCSHDAMPGQVHSRRHHSQCIAGLTSTPWQSCRTGYLPVGRYLTVRNGGNYVPDSLNGRIVLRRTGARPSRLFKTERPEQLAEIFPGTRQVEDLRATAFERVR